MHILSASNLGNKVLFHISKWHHVFPVLLVSAAGEVRINRSCGSPDTEHASHFTITEEEDMDGFAGISPCVWPIMKLMAHAGVLLRRHHHYARDRYTALLSVWPFNVLYRLRNNHVWVWLNFYHSGKPKCCVLLMEFNMRYANLGWTLS